MRPDERLARAEQALLAGRITQEEFALYAQRLATEAAQGPSGQEAYERIFAEEPQASSAERTVARAARAQERVRVYERVQERVQERVRHGMLHAQNAANEAAQNGAARVAAGARWCGSQASRAVNTLSNVWSTQSQERRHELLVKGAGVAGLFVFIIGLLWAFSGTGTPTGFAVLDTQETPVELTFTEHTNETLNLTNTTTFRITGTLTDGTGRVWLHAGGERLLVYEGEARARAVLWTEYESYARNTSINVSVNATNYTLWLVDESGERSPFTSGDAIAEPGSYTFDALITGATEKESLPLTVRNDTNTSENSPRRPPSATVPFTEACAETCTLNGTNLTVNETLEVETDGTLAITSITTTVERENSEPFQSAALPNLVLEPGETTTLNLDTYFTDPDGDTLTYDFMNLPGVTMAVDGSELSVTAESGEGGESVIYAGDLEYLVQSEPFSITVNGTNTTNEVGENGTAPAPAENRTTPRTNATPANRTGTNETGVKETASGRNRTAPPTAENVTTAALNCDHPDPNKRAPSCFAGEEERYFGQSVLVEDKGRRAVARFNGLGNLLLTGDLIEESSGTPSSDDFSVGYLDDNFRFVATAWIDSGTGDLHLRGTVSEEELSLTAPANSYTFQSRRGINLGYIDPRTGNLYLRGNIIPYRRSIT